MAHERGHLGECRMKCSRPELFGHVLGFSLALSGIAFAETRRGSPRVRRDLGQRGMSAMPRHLGRGRNRRRIRGRAQSPENSARPQHARGDHRLRSAGHANAGLAQWCLHGNQLLWIAHGTGAARLGAHPGPQCRRDPSAGRLSDGENRWQVAAPLSAGSYLGRASITDDPDARRTLAQAGDFRGFPLELRSCQSRIPGEPLLVQHVESTSSSLG